MRKTSTSLALLVCSTSLFAQTPVEVGLRRQLLVDEHLVDEMRGGAHLQLHSPRRQEVVMVTDRPWEGNASHFRSVFQDGELYRMYYGTYQYDVAEGKQTYPHPTYVCYAESRDGIRWTRPELGIVEFNGSTQNNIILSAASVKDISIDPGHVAVFKDSNPNCSGDARYKAIVRAKGKSGVYAFKSPDGTRFSPLSNQPIITEGAFDSQNLAFWDSERNEYRAYFRGFRNRIRSILTATSKDFLAWSKPEWVEFPGAPSEHIYTNQVIPYSRAPHLLVGFPMRYTDRGWQHSTGKLPHPELRRLRASISPRYGSAVTDGLFMTSRDRRHFKRWGEAFLRPGPARTNSWVYGDNSAAWGIVTTRSDLPKAPDELSIYVTEGYWTGKSLNVRRYSLRLDGFVSLHAPLAGGEMVTKPIVFQGDRLEINFSGSGAGGIRVEIQDSHGAPIKGFTESDCHEIFGDDIERTVAWQQGEHLASLAGKHVRFRFILKDADLFSFRFR